MQRHKVMARWVKSRQMPVRSRNVSRAVRLARARTHIVKSSMLVDKIADGLHTWPARLCLVEQRAREIFQGAVHFAITARLQEKQAIVR